MEPSKKRNLMLYILIITIIVIGVFVDLITKSLTAGKTSTLISGLISIFYTENTGAGWSILADKTIVLTIISAVVIVGLFIFNIFYKPKGKTYSIAMGLVLAGAIGNFLDRLFLGYVRDFINLDFIKFPIFNFADIFLTIGAILMCVWLVFLSSKANQWEKKQ